LAVLTSPAAAGVDRIAVSRAIITAIRIAASMNSYRMNCNAELLAL